MASSTTKPNRNEFNQQLIEHFRANRGEVREGPFAGRPVLLLTTTGARTGVRRTTPLVYTTDGDRLVVIASKGGAPTHPAWYHNLRANGQATVEVGDQTFQAEPGFPEGEEYERLYATQAALMPAFNEYRRRTSRRIPVVTLRPI